MGTISRLTVHVPVDNAKSLLTANERAHWSRRAKETRKWRSEAHRAVEAVSRGDSIDGIAHITVWFSFPTRRRRDVHNLYPTAKALVDGAVDAGLIPDDSDRYLIGPDIRRDHGPLGIRMEIRAA